MPEPNLFVIHEKWKHLREELLLAISNFDREGKVVQDDRNTVKTIEVSGKLLNFKRFRKPNFINSLAYRYLRQSKAERSYHYARKLQELGVGTPEPIAYLENNEGIGFGYSFYISKQSNYDLTYRELKDKTKVADAEDALKAFTRFMFHMHEQNVLFLDNSPGNTLITRCDSGYQFELVDLNRMQFKPLNYEERLRNFERLTTQKWMYEIMGREYARLAGQDPESTFEKMYKYMLEFQDKFKRRRKFKKWRRSLFK